MNIEGISETQKQQYKIEEETIKQLLVLENEFRAFNASMKEELQSQKEWIGRMWVLSQRYILLESTGPCCRFPEIYTGPAEDTLLHEFADKIKLLRLSNCKISNLLDELRKSCLVFEGLCSQLDMNVQTPLIIGDTFHKPISYFIELISDLFKYFHCWLLKLRYSAFQLDPYKFDSIENYRILTDTSEDFEEYLNVGLTYCKCLRPKPTCQQLRIG